MNHVLTLASSLALTLSVSISAYADDHLSASPIIAEIYECSLNDGVMAGDVVALGKGEFAKFASRNDLSMNTYLWEAVSINAPYDEADLRWVNYFPTWKDQSTADQLWRTKAIELQAKINKLITCKKPFFFPMLSIARPTQADEKPLMTQVCTLNQGKTMEDAMAFRTMANAVANEVSGAQTGSAVFMPGIGLSSGWDFVAMTTGTHDAMASMLDAVRDGSLRSAMAAKGLENPATCAYDMHRSHLMVQLQN